MSASRAVAAREDHARRLFWHLRRSAGLPSAKETEQPNRIFIAGCARSGTTLSRNLMACFDDIYVHNGEAPFPALLELDRAGKPTVSSSALS